jgi:hypothetical protein
MNLKYVGEDEETVKMTANQHQLLTFIDLLIQACWDDGKAVNILTRE